MNFVEYQVHAMRTAPEGEFKELLTNFAMGLSGEAGEATDQVKKYVFHGHTLDYEALAKELGDQLWYIANMASLLNFTLEDIAKMNVAKLQKRYPDGFKASDSVARVDVKNE